jgi:lysophospholipase L1-like esterase
MDVVTLGAAKADAKKRYRRNTNTIIWLGDSITGNGGGKLSPGAIASLTASSTAYDETKQYARGFWVWAQNLSGQRLRTIHNAGVGGETSAQILARVQGDVVAYTPGWCHVQAGTNDIGQGVSAATTKANLTAIWDALDTAGIRILVGTIPPRASYTGSQRADAELLNSWIVDQGRQRANLVVVDYHAVLAYPGTSGAGAYNLTYNYDTVHPSVSGAYAMGRLLADTLTLLVPPANFLLTGEGDARNLLTANTRFLSGGSGGVIGGWGLTTSGTPTLTYAKVARTDNVPGNWQSVVMDPANGVNFVLVNNASVGASLAIGDTVTGALEYQLSGLDATGTTGTKAFQLILTAYNGSSFTSVATDLATATENFPTASRSGVLRTPPLTVPSGTTLMQLQIKAFGGGTYLFDRAAIYNHTKLGLVG